MEISMTSAIIVPPVRFCEIPQFIVQLILRGDTTPISIFWNRELLFHEVWSFTEQHMYNHLRNVEPRKEAAVFLIDGNPVVRFFADTEFSRTFKAKCLIDISVYEENIPINREDQKRIFAIEKQAAAFGADLIRVYL